MENINYNKFLGYELDDDINYVRKVFFYKLIAAYDNFKIIDEKYKERKNYTEIVQNNYLYTYMVSESYLIKLFLDSDVEQYAKIIQINDRFPYLEQWISTEEKSFLCDEDKKNYENITMSKQEYLSYLIKIRDDIDNKNYRYVPCFMCVIAFENDILDEKVDLVVPNEKFKYNKIKVKYKDVK